MTAPDEPAREASLIYVIGRVDQGLRQAIRARLAPWALSVQQYTALSVLDRRPGLSNAQLARRALVTPQSMVEILSKLEQRGLVQRTADPDHALILRAELTREGRALLADVDPGIGAIQDAAFAGVPREEQDVALRAMTTAMNRLAEGLGG